MAHRAHHREGDVVLRAGERVGVAEVGILATVGAVQLAVHAVPRVAVLSTGGLGVRRTRVPCAPNKRPGAWRHGTSGGADPV